MAVTTLFWGAAAVLQFAVLRWASDVLGLPLHRAAYLQGAVAVGIVAGAALAGRWVPLAHATRVLPLGVALGLLVPLVSVVPSWQVALPLLLLVGALGGAMVVPLNACCSTVGTRC
jgi:LPLT family lysophospholipid transporter-like MFS transporter